MIEVIAFDADDTLWHNETLYSENQEKFQRLLLGYRDAQWIAKKLYETEIANLKHFGYGVKGFTLSMIETAIELTEGRIQGAEIQEILNFAKEMLAAPVEVLDGAREAVEALAQRYPLMLITKGDLFDQETKIARSRLGHLFSHIEIWSEKDEEAYRALFAKHKLDPARFLMVGNSLKSDVLPVLACGGAAVYIPYKTTWAHERESEPQLWEQGYYRLEHIGQLPELVKGLK